MNRAAYMQFRDKLSLEFLREKQAGTIPIDTGWADWCWSTGVYPLTDEPRYGIRSVDDPVDDGFDDWSRQIDRSQAPTWREVVTFCGVVSLLAVLSAPLWAPALDQSTAWLVGK